METLSQILARDRKIAVLTGAGISVPSGIPPFRGPNGLYRNTDVERRLSIDYFHNHPKDFWNFYWSLFNADLLLSAVPNAVHRWLKSLEDRSLDITVITQNIDGLHVRSGSHKVIEMHGSFARTVCPICGKIYATQSIRNQKVPRCSTDSGNGRTCGTILKPDIVLFGEAVHGFEQAELALRKADRLMIMGTSLGVAPVNMLPVYAKMNGVPTLLVNDRPALQMDCIDQFARADFNHFDPDAIHGQSI